MVVLDRKNGIWYAIDFDDEQFGGYSVTYLESLRNECKFLDLIERPGLWRTGGWRYPESGRRQPFDRKNIPGYLTTPTHENRGIKRPKKRSEYRQRWKEVTV